MDDAASNEWSLPEQMQQNDEEQSEDSEVNDGPTLLRRGVAAVVFLLLLISGAPYWATVNGGIATLAGAFTGQVLIGLLAYKFIISI